jgi:aryl-alcohol dehydrogenase-like predicted oxidoreductase
MPMEHRALGKSGLEVSRLALGSWKTFGRLPRHAGVEVMAEAKRAGINFLDDARYDDDSGLEPIPSGYSEVVFGELVRAVGWERPEVVVANKLWWEFWPSEQPEEELGKSLERMGFEYLDLVYSAPLPPGLAIEDALERMTSLLEQGKARAWGVLNWSASHLEEAVLTARRHGLREPCAAQLPYSFVRRSPVEDPGMVEALKLGGVRIVSSATMAGGALTGKYLSPQAAGRLAGRMDQAENSALLRASSKLVEAAAKIGVSAAALALAFALTNDQVVSVLFGATSAGQVRENATAVDVAGRLKLEGFSWPDLRSEA